MILLQDWYDPKETADIINETVKPTPRLNLAGLCTLAANGKIDCHGWYRLDSGKEIRFKIVENIESIWFEYVTLYLETQQAYADRLIAVKEWRQLAPPAKFSAMKGNISVPAGSMLYFSRDDIECFIANSSVKSAAAEHQQFSSKETPKVLEVIEGLKAICKDFAEIDKSDLPAEMKRLILQYYSFRPTQADLIRDLSLHGVEVSRPTAAKYLDIAFGGADVKP